MDEREKLLAEVQELYAKVGEIYVEDAKNGMPVPAKYQDAVSAAKAVLDKIQAIEDAELESQGLKRCPACKKTVVLDSVFCNYCGTKFGAKNEEATQLVLDPAPEYNPDGATEYFPDPIITAPPVAEPAKKVCANCGAELDNDALFCVECGTKVI